jgi:hypothetical protein
MLRRGSTRDANPQGPLNACREVRHPGHQANRQQIQGPETSARRSESAVTVHDDMEIHIAQKKLVWSMAVGGLELMLLKLQLCDPIFSGPGTGAPSSPTACAFVASLS